jgi:transcriptional regulator with PAS, ATPase and Fis domain
VASDPSPPETHDFRWQALFQRARDPIFVLNRRRRFLFVNRAWESLTGVSAAEARGLVCPRRAPAAQDPPDLVIRTLCCPPPEVLKGQPGRSRRQVPPNLTTGRWWDVDFMPFHDERGVLCILGRITNLPQDGPAPASTLPEKLAGLREATAQRYGLDQLMSNHPALQCVVEQVRLASQTRVSVLIRGEPGTGKHWVARTIHYLGPGREATCAVIACARLPLAALAFVLFGPGSSAWRTAGATLYLQEPQHLPRDLQARLAAEVREWSASGGPRGLAGFSTDPLQEVRAGRLLEELSCVLGTVVVSLPPLRERLEDLPLLVERLLVRAHAEGGRRITGLTAEAWELLRAYSWPGNLRELYAVLRSACGHTWHDRIEASHLPASLRLAVRLDQTAGPTAERTLPLDQLLEQAERRLILLALRRAQGNRSRAAEILAIWRPRLLRRMEMLGIDS